MRIEDEEQPLRCLSAAILSLRVNGSFLAQFKILKKLKQQWICREFYLPATIVANPSVTKRPVLGCLCGLGTYGFTTNGGASHPRGEGDASHNRGHSLPRNRPAALADASNGNSHANHGSDVGRSHHGLRRETRRPQTM